MAAVRDYCTLGGDVALQNPVPGAARGVAVDVIVPPQPLSQLAAEGLRELHQSKTGLCDDFSIYGPVCSHIRDAAFAHLPSLALSSKDHFIRSIYWKCEMAVRACSSGPAAVRGVLIRVETNIGEKETFVSPFRPDFAALGDYIASKPVLVVAAQRLLREHASDYRGGWPFVDEESRKWSAYVKQCRADATNRNKARAAAHSWDEQQKQFEENMKAYEDRVRIWNRERAHWARQKWGEYSKPQSVKPTEPGPRPEAPAGEEGPKPETILQDVMVVTVLREYCDSRDAEVAALVHHDFGFFIPLLLTILRPGPAPAGAGFDLASVPMSERLGLAVDVVGIMQSRLAAHGWMQSTSSNQYRFDYSHFLNTLKGVKTDADWERLDQASCPSVPWKHDTILFEINGNWTRMDGVLFPRLQANVIMLLRPNGEETFGAAGEGSFMLSVTKSSGDGEGGATSEQMTGDSITVRQGFLTDALSRMGFPTIEMKSTGGSNPSYDWQGGRADLLHSLFLAAAPHSSSVADVFGGLVRFLIGATGLVAAERTLKRSTQPKAKMRRKGEQEKSSENDKVKIDQEDLFRLAYHQIFVERPVPLPAGVRASRGERLSLYASTTSDGYGTLPVAYLKRAFQGQLTAGKLAWIDFGRSNPSINDSDVHALQELVLIRPSDDVPSAGTLSEFKQFDIRDPGSSPFDCDDDAMVANANGASSVDERSLTTLDWQVGQFHAFHCASAGHVGGLRLSISTINLQTAFRTAAGNFTRTMEVPQRWIARAAGVKQQTLLHQVVAAVQAPSRLYQAELEMKSSGPSSDQDYKIVSWLVPDPAVSRTTATRRITAEDLIDVTARGGPSDPLVGCGVGSPYPTVTSLISALSALLTSGSVNALITGRSRLFSAAGMLPTSAVPPPGEDSDNDIVLPTSTADVGFTAPVCDDDGLSALSLFAHAVRLTPSMTGYITTDFVNPPEMPTFLINAARSIAKGVAADPVGAPLADSHSLLTGQPPFNQHYSTLIQLDVTLVETMRAIGNDVSAVLLQLLCAGLASNATGHKASARQEQQALVDRAKQEFNRLLMTLLLSLPSPDALAAWWLAHDAMCRSAGQPCIDPRLIPGQPAFLALRYLLNIDDCINAVISTAIQLGIEPAEFVTERCMIASMPPWMQSAASSEAVDTAQQQQQRQAITSSFLAARLRYESLLAVEGVAFMDFLESSGKIIVPAGVAGSRMPAAFSPVLCRLLGAPVRQATESFVSAVSTGQNCSVASARHSDALLAALADHAKLSASEKHRGPVFDRLSFVPVPVLRILLHPTSSATSDRKGCMLLSLAVAAVSVTDCTTALAHYAAACAAEGAHDSTVQLCHDAIHAWEQSQTPGAIMMLLLNGVVRRNVLEVEAQIASMMKQEAAIAAAVFDPDGGLTPIPSSRFVPDGIGGWIFSASAERIPAFSQLCCGPETKAAWLGRITELLGAHHEARASSGVDAAANEAVGWAINHLVKALSTELDRAGSPNDATALSIVQRAVNAKRVRAWASVIHLLAMLGCDVLSATAPSPHDTAGNAAESSLPLYQKLFVELAAVQHVRQQSVSHDVFKFSEEMLTDRQAQPDDSNMRAVAINLVLLGFATERCAATTPRQLREWTNGRIPDQLGLGQAMAVSMCATAAEALAYAWSRCISSSLNDQRFATAFKSDDVLGATALAARMHRAISSHARLLLGYNVPNALVRTAVCLAKAADIDGVVQLLKLGRTPIQPLPQLLTWTHTRGPPSPFVKAQYSELVRACVALGYDVNVQCQYALVSAANNSSAAFNDWVLPNDLRQLDTLPQSRMPLILLLLRSLPILQQRVPHGPNLTDTLISAHLTTAESCGARVDTLLLPARVNYLHCVVHYTRDVVVPLAVDHAQQLWKRAEGAVQRHGDEDVNKMLSSVKVHIGGIQGFAEALCSLDGAAKLALVPGGPEEAAPTQLVGNLSRSMRQRFEAQYSQAPLQKGRLIVSNTVYEPIFLRACEAITHPFLGIVKAAQLEMKSFEAEAKSIKEMERNRQYLDPEWRSVFHERTSDFGPLVIPEDPTFDLASIKN